MISLNQETHQQLKEIIEDSVEFFCDENMVSGELTWIVIQCLAEAKIAQLRNEVV